MQTLFKESYVLDTGLLDYRGLESEIGRVMITAVGTHTNEHDSFSALKQDGEQYPFQRADCVAVTGQVATVEAMQNLAPLIFPSYDTVVDRLIDTRKDMLSAAAGALEVGKDIVVASDHRDVIVVAINSCIFTGALLKLGYINTHDVNTEIVVSTMLKNTGILGLPAVDVMQGVFAMTRFVVPSNNKRNKLQLPAEYVEQFNAQSMDARKSYNAKPKITALAPSATTDIKMRGMPTRRNPFGLRYKMGPPTDGTIKEYMLNKFILATGGDLSQGEKGIFFGNLFRDTQVKSDTDAYTVMQHIADGMTEKTGIETEFVPDVVKFQQLKATTTKPRTRHN